MGMVMENANFDFLEESLVVSILSKSLEHGKYKKICLDTVLKNIEQKYLSFVLIASIKKHDTIAFLNGCNIFQSINSVLKMSDLSLMTTEYLSDNEVIHGECIQKLVNNILANLETGIEPMIKDFSTHIVPDAK